MSLSTKILIWLGGFLVVSTLGFIVYKQVEISNRQHAIETQIVSQMELANNIMRSQNKYASKEDIENLIKDKGLDLKAIEDDLDKLRADLVAINTLIIASSGQKGTNIPGKTGTVNPDPHPVDPANPDPFGYLAAEQLLDVDEKFSNLNVPFGTVGFSAWKKYPWSIDIASREYHMVNVLGTDENKRLYVYNKFHIVSGGKKYDIKIASAKTEQVYPMAKWSWWNPRLSIGADVGVRVPGAAAEFTPNLNVNVMSYGKYKTQPDFLILSLGFGYGTVSEKPQVVVTPVTYNVGKHVPLMNNTYLGPSLHFDKSGNMGVMGGIRVGL
jgi:hypothetical protein